MLPRRTSKILRVASMYCVLRWESCVTTVDEVGGTGQSLSSVGRGGVSTQSYTTSLLLHPASSHMLAHASASHHQGVAQAQDESS